MADLVFSLVLFHPYPWFANAIAMPLPDQDGDCSPAQGFLPNVSNLRHLHVALAAMNRHCEMSWERVRPSSMACFGLDLLSVSHSTPVGLGAFGHAPDEECDILNC